tara:strand:- start:11 stop:328 length:318 start_codon:yes stop_codon:yes gene_type:complete
MRHEAIRKIHPEVVSIYEGDVWRCIDENEVEVTIDTTKVDAEEKKLQAEYDAQEYARKRKEEYPELAEQLDLLWHAIDAGTLDDRDHRNKFYTTLKQVKENNPKG